MKTYIDCLCPNCHEINLLAVYTKDYDAWQNGLYAQDAFPYLSPNEREMLISGICPTCWNKIFGSDEDFEPLDEDWDYNEDSGFDPYMGEYTFDC